MPTTELVKQPTAAPVRKVRVAAIIGTIVAVALAVVDASANAELPASLVAAATLVATVGSAYLARSAAVD